MGAAVDQVEIEHHFGEAVFLQGPFCFDALICKRFVVTDRILNSLQKVLKK